MLNDDWRGQDALALINVGRAASGNSGRISAIKADSSIAPPNKRQVQAFRQKKLLFDHVTGLCPVEDERLVRSREAMLLAVELFNTPRIASEAGVFSMLTNVAWTYLLHEFYERQGVETVSADGFSQLL